MGGNSSPPASGRNGRVTVTNRINTGLSGVFTVTSNGYIMVTVTFGSVAGVNEEWKPRNTRTTRKLAE